MKHRGERDGKFWPRAFNDVLRVLTDVDNDIDIVDDVQHFEQASGRRGLLHCFRDLLAGTAVVKPLDRRLKYLCRQFAEFGIGRNPPALLLNVRQQANGRDGGRLDCRYRAVRSRGDW